MKKKYIDLLLSGEQHTLEDCKKWIEQKKTNKVFTDIFWAQKSFVIADTRTGVGKPSAFQLKINTLEFLKTKYLCYLILYGHKPLCGNPKYRVFCHISPEAHDVLIKSMNTLK